MYSNSLIHVVFTVNALFSVGPLDNILYADGLPEDTEDTTLKAEFPDADMIAVPMTRGKKQG